MSKKKKRFLLILRSGLLLSLYGKYPLPRAFVLEQNTVMLLFITFYRLFYFKINIHNKKDG